ncbi:MAG: 3-phosphoshikimate 1-carboxyvinyltransferase [Myxococcales bacterium]|nr:3-phosphoshikimate 1-carboxyvinyltransferase [Myxococcales bacterium]
MTAFVVTPTGRPLAGQVTAPGDKSVGHRALLFSALARTRVRIRGLGGGADNGRTARAIIALGATTERVGDALIVRGPGLRHLHAPPAPIDCGNSGTTIRLLTGLLAGQPFASELFGDESLSRRPMARVIAPLRAMGAHITGRAGGVDVSPPLTIAACAERLRGCDHALAIASAQVKTALVLAGLCADGTTRVREPWRSRDHSEHLLTAMGAPIRVRDREVEVHAGGWDGALAIDQITVPGDPSSAAFILAAALVAGVGGDGVSCVGVNQNPTRTGFLDALAAMGWVAPTRDPVTYYPGEDGVTIDVRGPAPALRATRIAGELTVRAIDEIPILAAVAALAEGETVIEDAGELKVKESDRIATTVAMLRAFGVDAEAQGEGLVVVGRGRRTLRAARVDSAGDHRIAMAGTVLALVADGPSRIDDADNVATSYPGFVAALTSLGADLRVEP